LLKCILSRLRCHQPLQSRLFPRSHLLLLPNLESSLLHHRLPHRRLYHLFHRCLPRLLNPSEAKSCQVSLRCFRLSLLPLHPAQHLVSLGFLLSLGFRIRLHYLLYPQAHHQARLGLLDLRLVLYRRCRRQLQYFHRAHHSRQLHQRLLRPVSLRYTLSQPQLLSRLRARQPLPLT